MNDKPIRTALIGFGTSGRVFHAPFIDADGDYSLDMIVTRDPSRVADTKSRYPESLPLATPKELWDRADELDLVVIGSPNSSHFELADAALEAGLDVVVDKPFVVRVDDGRRLIAKAKQLGRKLAVFQNRRWDGDFLTVRDLVESGELGSIRRFESRFEWWKPAPPASWKTEARVEDGGGILFDLGPHVVDQAIQLFGAAELVHAEVSRCRDVSADDDVFLALRHRSGLISHLWMSAVIPLPGPRFNIVGSRAGYRSWGLDPQEPSLIGGAHPGDAGFGELHEDRWGTLHTDDHSVRVPSRRGDYGEFYRRLAGAIRRGGELPVDPDDAQRVLEIIDAAHRLVAST